MTHEWHGFGQRRKRDTRLERRIVLFLLAFTCWFGGLESPSDAQYLTPSGITFTAKAGAGAPPNQTIGLVAVNTTVRRTWTVSKSSNWLQVSPTSGDIFDTPDWLTAAVNTSGMGQGIYTDTIVIRLVDPSGNVTTTSTSVTLNLTGGSSSPTIALSPASMSFSGSAGGSVPPVQSISLTNPGGGTLNWSISASVPWLLVTPASGTTRNETDTISVTANTAGLAAGSYSGMLTMSGNGVNAPQQVMVNLTLSNPSVQSPILSVSPGSLSVSAVQGTKGPLEQKITISNTGGGGAVTWTATTPSWTVATPTVGWLWVASSGVTPGDLLVHFYPDGWPQGTYSTNITVTSPGATGSPKTIPVTMTVTGPTQQTPVLSANPTSLSIAAPLGGVGPMAYHVNISNTGGGGAVTWTATTPSWTVATPTVGWLWVAPSGVTPGDLLVHCYPNGWPQGTYSTNITVTSPGASPKTIPVTMTVGTPTALVTASVTASWSANTDSDLAGYKVYYGTSSGSYTNSINVGNVTTYTVNGLSTGRTYYFAVSAFDKSGNESKLSTATSITR